MCSNRKVSPQCDREATETQGFSYPMVASLIIQYSLFRLSPLSCEYSCKTARRSAYIEQPGDQRQRFFPVGLIQGMQLGLLAQGM